MKRTKLVNPAMLAGRKGLYAMGLLGLLVLAGSAIVLVHPAHADTGTSASAGDSDQGAACTGIGDNQQGDCNSQTGGRTGPDASSAVNASGQ